MGDWRIIVAEEHILGGVGGHRIIALVDDQGVVQRQFNGLATSYNQQTGLPKIEPVGWGQGERLVFWEWQRGDPSAILGQYQPITAGTELTLAFGSEQSMMVLWQAGLATGVAWNKSDNGQAPLYPFGGLGVNSNSVWSNLLIGMGFALPSNMTDSRLVPGVGIGLMPTATFQAVWAEFLEPFGLHPDPHIARALRRRDELELSRRLLNRRDIPLDPNQSLTGPRPYQRSSLLNHDPTTSGLQYAVLNSYAENVSTGWSASGAVSELVGGSPGQFTETYHYYNVSAGLERVVTLTYNTTTALNPLDPDSWYTAPNLTVVRHEETLQLNGNSVVERSVTTQADGSLLTLFDGASFDGDVVSMSVRTDAAGRLVEEPNVEVSNSAGFQTAQIAQIFGTTIGRHLGGDDAILGIAQGALLGTVALNLGQMIDQASARVVLPEGQSAWSDFPNELANFAANAAIGAVSSYLVLELGEALGLEGFGAELFTTGASTLLGNTLNNLVADTNVLSGIGLQHVSWFDDAGLTVDGQVAIASAIASFLGAKLGSLVVTPQTQSAVVLSSIGSAAGAYIGTGLVTGEWALIGAKAFSWGGFVGAAVGAFVGFVLGAFIGNLFGRKKPKTLTAGAEVELQIPQAHYELGAVTQANGGNLNLARSMGLAARDTLNGLIAVITRDDPEARVSNTNALLQKYGHIGNQLWVQYDANFNGTLASNEKVNVDSADEAVDKGVLWAIPNTKIVGGDLFLKRALYNMTRHPGQVTSVAQLAGDLQIADGEEDQKAIRGIDFPTNAFYLQNRAIIDAVIAEPWTSMTEAQQDFYTSNKAFMTRDAAWYAANDNRLPTVALAC